MKREFFDPKDAYLCSEGKIIGFGTSRHLPKMTSRRMFGGAGARSSCYKSDGDEADLLEKIQKKINEGLETRAAKTDIPENFKKLTSEQLLMLSQLNGEQLRSIMDEKTGVMATLQAQGVLINQLKTQVSTREQPDLSLRGQIKTWLEGKAEKGGDETVLQRVKKLQAGTKVELPPLELRVADNPMTTVTINPGTSPYIGRTQVEGGINDILSYPFTFWESLTKGRTNATTYVWINKTNRQGAAAFIAQGGAKPGISFQLIADNSVAKKIADSATTTTELLDDIDGMATFIEEELRFQVMSKVNSTLMNSVGSSTVPEGIQQVSVAYADTLDPTAIKTTNPNHMDAIRAVTAQIKSLPGLVGQVTVFINPLDAANMDLKKATDSGVYLLPPFVTADGRTIGGARVIEDNNIPVGFLQAAILRYYRILIYKDFTVSWGWINDDFTHNRVTAVGEMRLHQFVNDIHAGFAVYDSFENIETAITE